MDVYGESHRLRKKFERIPSRWVVDPQMLSQRITIEQKQTLIMTPRLQQAIQLLQLSSLELSQYMEEELKSNPILEAEIEQPEEKIEMEEGNIWDDYLANTDYAFNQERGMEQSRDDVNYESFISAQPTLTEFLLSQFTLFVSDTEERTIGEYLIGCLDERGFLSVTIEEVGATLDAEPVKVAQVVQKLQSLEPVGIGAQNLVESLLIQCKFHYGNAPLVERIIQNHLEDLGENRIKQIASQLKVTPTEVQHAADLIKRLNPRPAAGYITNFEAKYIEPDVYIQKVGEEYVVIMNDVATPRLRINSYYRKILKSLESGEEAREYLEKKLNSALWLIRSIEQRRMTIYRIVETIIELQRPFLDRGVKYLQPMTLNEVAERIDVHESTVSRATANKYVQTPRGIFELKFFFNSGISSDVGDGLASVGVKEIIQELIKGEDPCHPWSDQQMAEMIEARGYTISRRTVAKYRDELGVPSSSKRRRFA